MTSDLELHPNDLTPAPTTLFTGLTRDQVDLLKITICKDATDDELQLFVAVCNSRRLNPFTGQIHFVKRRQWNAKLNGGEGGYEQVGSHQTGIDGYRLIADRTGRYQGKIGTWWCGPDGHWRDVWLEDYPPAAAKVAVQRRGFAKPTEAIARWKAYVQTKRDGKPNAMWARMDAEQLAKCAEALALRTAFPEELSGIYTADEMAQATNPPAVVVDGGTGEVIDLERDGILAPGWRDIGEQNNAHHRLNVFLANNGLGDWAAYWLDSKGYQGPLSRRQMDELRAAVQAIRARRAELSGGLSEAADTSASVSSSPPDPTSPSAPEQEEASELARSRAEGANPDRKPGTNQADPPPVAGATTAPESTAAPSPGRRSSGAPNVPAGEGAKGARLGRSAGRGSQRDQGESHGSPAGRAPTDEEAEQAAFEQGLASDDPGRFTR